MKREFNILNQPEIKLMIDLGKLRRHKSPYRSGSICHKNCNFHPILQETVQQSFQGKHLHLRTVLYANLENSMSKLKIIYMKLMT